MRTLFIAVGKVFGLLQVYAGLTYVLLMLPLMHMVGQASFTVGAVSVSTAPGSTLALTATSMTAMLVLTFGVAWLLLFRADWLADRLKIPEKDELSPLNDAVILGVGVRLLGLFAIIQAAPDLIDKLGTISSAVQQLMGVRESMGVGVMERTLISWVWSSLVPPALKLAFGFLLTLKANTVIKWITGKKSDPIGTVS